MVWYGVQLSKAGFFIAGQNGSCACVMVCVSATSVFISSIDLLLVFMSVFISLSIIIAFKTLTTYRLEDWSMGGKRSFHDYMDMVGLDVVKKTVVKNSWCGRGEWPKQALPYKVPANQKMQY